MNSEIEQFKKRLEQSWKLQAKPEESESHERMTAWLAWLAEGNAVRILQNANDRLIKSVEYLQDENSVLRSIAADQRDLIDEAYCLLSDAYCLLSDASDGLRRARIVALMCFIVAIAATASRAF